MNATASTFSSEYARATMNITDFMATIALMTWTIGFMIFMTAKGNHEHQFGQTAPTHTNNENEHEIQTEIQPLPPTNGWKNIGIYHLNKPQTLSKAEREALATVGGNAAFLYERTYKSGAKSWRYAIGDTWFYPTESAVKRRGLDLFGNDTLDVE
jgi:hypothetical protein